MPVLGDDLRDHVSDFVHKVARVVAEGQAGVRTLSDGPEGPTTESDLWAEDVLVAGLTGILDGTVVAEERRRVMLLPDDPGSWTWVIDPIDGTSSYALGAQTWGVQVALCSGGNPVGAWIDCPRLGWRLAACDGSGLQIEGVVPALTPERVVAGEGDFEPSCRAALNRAGIHRRGTMSCAVDYAQLVAGSLDAVVFRRTYPWDHVPGAYLVRRSGGSVTRWDGSRYEPQLAGEGVLAYRKGVDLGLVKVLLSRSCEPRSKT